MRGTLHASEKEVKNIRGKAINFDYLTKLVVPLESIDEVQKDKHESIYDSALYKKLQKQSVEEE